MSALTKKILSGAACALIVAALAGSVLWPADDQGPAAPPAPAAAAQIARGAYLARAGDCMACHTSRGGAPYAGGRALQTPFGSVLSPNLTPDRATGIGTWSADDFWRALHNGKSKDGRLLYPAFPYTNYTKIRRADADALYAYLQSLAPVSQLNRPHQLRFPYNQQLVLAAWRALYFRPAVWREQSAQSAAWNRGAYLVQGLGHCSACHSSRDALGGSADSLDGGMIPVLGWYAPALSASAENGLGDWDSRHIVALLKTGVSPRATAVGPMAEVVQASLQHLSEADLAAMALYLKSLPATAAEAADEEADTSPRAKAVLAAGARLYETHCVDCHQADGRGAAPAYPALAGNRAVLADEAANPIRIVLNGGYPPGTAGNPRPYGMPAFGPLLSDAEVAALLTYLRSAWGNRAPAVSALDVNGYRSVPLD